MLEIGKLYVVKTKHGNCWLFKKKPHRCITGCSKALYLKDMDCWHSATYVCDDSQIVWIKPANRNHIVIWNRMFNDNVEMV